LQVVSEHADAAGGFVHQRADDADGGRFPRPVRPQKRVKITGLYFKIYSAQRLNAARIGFLSCSSSSAIAMKLTYLQF
jgi:hypothetical protein